VNLKLSLKAHYNITSLYFYYRQPLLVRRVSYKKLVAELSRGRMFLVTNSIKELNEELKKSDTNCQTRYTSHGKHGCIVAVSTNNCRLTVTNNLRCVIFCQITEVIMYAFYTDYGPHWSLYQAQKHTC